MEDSLAYDKEELILELTPQGQALGFSIDELGRVLRDRLNGIEAATYPVGNAQAEIRVELPEGELTADFLDRTQIRVGRGLRAAGRRGDRRKRARDSRRCGAKTACAVKVTGDISEDDPARAQEIMEP